MVLELQTQYSKIFHTFSIHDFYFKNYCHMCIYVYIYTIYSLCDTVQESLQFSSVRESVRKCYGLNNQRLKAGKSRRLSLSQNIQMTSAAYPASYSMSRVGSFSRVKVARVWGWPLTSIYCWFEEWVEMYVPLLVYLYGMYKDTSPLKEPLIYGVY